MNAVRYNEITTVYNSYVEKHGRDVAPPVWIFAEVFPDGRFFAEEEADFRTEDDKLLQQKVTKFLQETKISPDEMDDWADEVMCQQTEAFHDDFEKAREKREGEESWRDYVNQEE